MKRISIQTLFGHAVAFPGDLCPQVDAQRPVGSSAASRVRSGHGQPQDGEPQDGEPQDGERAAP